MKNIKGVKKISKELKLDAESSRNFKDGFGSLKEFVKSSGLFTALDKFQEVANFKVTDPALALIRAQVNSETLESRTQLMLDLMDLIQTESVQNAISTVSGFINILISSADDLLTTFNILDRFAQLIPGVSSNTDKYATAIDRLNSDVEYLDQAVEKFMRNLGLQALLDLADRLDSISKIDLTMSDVFDQFTGNTNNNTILPTNPTGFDNLK